MAVPEVSTYLTSADLVAALRRDVRDGLTRSPKTLPPKWFYDERGSALFEEITRLPEYYPTRVERRILEERAAEIAAVTGAGCLVELGAGSGEKTRLLLDALRAGGTLDGYVPVDVSGDFLADAAAKIAAEYPEISVHAIVADFEHHLEMLPRAGRRLVAFLGSTIGNLEPARRAAFLTEVRSTLREDDSLLLGFDLVKDPGRLVAAYADSRGVTAEFNRNVLRVINRELGADFVPEAFEHVARWNAANEWMEMFLRSVREQVVSIPEIDLSVEFAAGEEMRTEISAKFRAERVRVELAASGFALAHWWTDAHGDFALGLAHPFRV